MPFGMPHLFSPQAYKIVRLCFRRRSFVSFLGSVSPQAILSLGLFRRRRFLLLLLLPCGGPHRAYRSWCGCCATASDGRLFYALVSTAVYCCLLLSTAVYCCVYSLASTPIVGIMLCYTGSAISFIRLIALTDDLLSTAQHYFWPSAASPQQPSQIRLGLYILYIPVFMYVCMCVCVYV